MNAPLPFGFADPGLASQATFRALLDAMARPGLVVTPPAPGGLPPGLSAAAGSACLTLFDLDTTVFVDRADPTLSRWLAFHTGAPLTTDEPVAAFALLLDPATARFDRFRQGTDVAPETSTTLILQLPSLTGGPDLRLTGPGIETQAMIAPKALPAALLELRSRARFPEGVDLILAAGPDLVCLPRTTQIEGA